MAKLFVRSALLIGFRETVRELGGDPVRLLKETGLSPMILEDPELLISYDTFLRLLNLAAKDTGCEYFGLLLSKHLDLSLFGKIGLLLQHSDTVGDALHFFVRYLPTRFQGIKPALKVDGELAYLYGHSEHSDENIIQNKYLTMGVVLTLMKSLCGEKWKPIEIHFIENRPKHADFFTRFVGAPVRFNQDSAQLIFDASDLKKKIVGKFGQFGHYTQPLIEEMESRLSTDIVSRTESLIKTLLPDGGCNVENITSLLLISESSLQRRLKARGTSFRQLVEKVRKSIALQHLHHSDLPKSQLAYMLGYTELSAFTRAFKRWFGVAPSKWKEQ